MFHPRGSARCCGSISLVRQRAVELELQETDNVISTVAMLLELEVSTCERT